MRGATGSIIAAVDPGGPASTGGSAAGRRAVRDRRCRSPTDSRAFMRAIVQIPVGQPVELTVWRDGKEQTFKATVAEWPNFMPGGGVMSAQTAEAMIQKMPDPGVQAGTADRCGTQAVRPRSEA